MGLVGIFGALCLIGAIIGIVIWRRNVAMARVRKNNIQILNNNASTINYTIE